MQEKKLEFQKILSNIIRSYRLQKRKSISKIAHEIDLTKSVWSEIEHANRDPQLSTIWRMAEGLEIPLSKIILDIEKQMPKDFFIEN